MASIHWMTAYDENGDNPAAMRCDCDLDEDHTEEEYRAWLDELERSRAQEQEEGGDAREV